MEFKDRLKRIRQERNLSQQALADAIYVSRSAVAKWENGLGLPGESSYQSLLSYFGMTAEEFPLNEEVEAVYVAKNKRIFTLSATAIVLVSLLTVGLLLLCLATVLSVITIEQSASQGIGIIGGADLPTFWLILRHGKDGLYFALTVLGVLSLLASVFFLVLAKRK